ncbi:helicase-associated domain-containing protein [Curtobacterium flaccumfaciens pv. flaccumfaciens]|uniref:helicase-associated domain-containing protein n=1 Tax=Curtobacterium flaccumfaciens TaxID=2035 RepID=UPI00265ACA92|nr:helicase-associated domain-containing protein [Curtobacterium flaccumfaciens]MCS5508798.1 helicase-associated domain-containing protein [Curtobacterium flaccumfaciens pv. flaccumfaciens]MCX2786394.1 helicase-associated domain-containing protein [Curtobacterium flaccumfaciens pv. flaccumfaciens]
MTTTADLAARLRAMPDDALERLVAARRLPTAALAETGPQRITDFFDLAEALRSDDAVDAAVEHLPRATILALRDGGAVDALGPAIELGLADEDGAVDDAVAARVAAHPDLTSLDEQPGGPEQVRPAAPALDAAALERARTTGAEQAFATMTVLAELLRAVDVGAVRELVKGGIGMPLARTLAERIGTDAELVAGRLALLDGIGFADPDTGRWIVTDAGHAWLLAGWPERWVSLVAAWSDTLPPAVHQVLDLADGDLRDLVPLGRWAYPAGSRWLDALLLDVAGTAASLGLAVDGIVTSTGRALLDGDAEQAADDLPGTVERVYLQHDLTVIAPGPLAPVDDDALRTVAVLEAPGLAARYRISEDTLRAAFRAGHSRDDLLSLLGRLSATGIPQPLAYLIDQVAGRDGSIVVDRGPGGVGTEVRGTADQLDLVGVDAELRQLAWERPDLTTLTTRYPPHVVHTALEDQRYPAVLTTAARPEAHHGPPGRRSPTGRSPEQSAHALVERLRLTTQRGDAEPEQEWLGRQIDLAVRGRTPIRVTVRMPDGSERPFSIVPTSVAAGRVRGRDTAVDVERTLPLSLVVSVESDA